MRKFCISSPIIVFVAAFLAIRGGMALRRGPLPGVAEPGGVSRIGRAAMPVGGRNVAQGRPYRVNRAVWRDKEYRMTELGPGEDAHGPQAFTWPASFDSDWSHARVGKFTYYRGELTDGVSASGPDRPQVVRWQGDDYDGQSLAPTPLQVTLDLQRTAKVWGARIGLWRKAPEADAPAIVEVSVAQKVGQPFRTVARLTPERGGSGRRVYGIAFPTVRARFVRLTFNNTTPEPIRAILLDEIEIVGRQVGREPGLAALSGPRVPKRMWLPGPPPAAELTSPRKLNLRVEWGFGPTYRLWRGGIRVQGGRIESVRDFRFDRYRFVAPKRMDRLLDQAPASCQWASATGGDTDGVLLTLRGDGKTTVVFSAKGLKREAHVPLKRLLERPARTEEFLVGKEGHKVRFFVPHVFPEKVEPIRKVKPLTPRSLLAVGSIPACVIVIPADPAYRPLAERLRSAIGVARIPILTARQVMDGRLRIARNLPGNPTLILIGNLCNNEATIPLYGRGHYFADEVYPGKGGYEVRTICDPFGLGRNVITLSGVGLDEAALAVNAFVQALRRDRRTGFVFTGNVIELDLRPLKHPTVVPSDFVLGSTNKRSPLRWTPKAAARAVGEVKAALVKGDARSLRGAVRLAFALGEGYYGAGDRDIARLAHEAIMAVTPKLAAWPDKAKLFPGMAGVKGLVPAWDHVEECGFFTDAERLDVTNALLVTCREVLSEAHRGHHSLLRQQGIKVRFDNNHGTCWGRAAQEAGFYFRDYYQRPEADSWLWGVAALNIPTALSHKNIEDAAGYGGYMPIDAFDWALRSGDSTYLDRGVLRSHADWAMISVNNLGVLAGYGDTVGFSAHNAYKIIGLAAWAYGDTHCRWFYDHMLRPVPPNDPRKTLDRYNTILSVRQGMSVPKRVGAPATPPDYLLGVSVLPHYRDSALSWRSGRNRHGSTFTDPIFDPKVADPPRFFDKLSFREAWTRDSQYLLLDGRYNGVHGQSDSNSIVSFTDNGRQWLFDNDSCTRNSVPNHSSVSFSVGGQRRDAEREALLVNHADLGDFGFSWTRLPNASAGDWDRQILWRKGKHFVVFDKVRFRARRARYLVRCNWKTMGDCKLTPEGLEVEQEAQKFHIKSDGAARLRMRRMDHTQYGSWRAYPFLKKPSDAWATYLEEWRLGDFGAGDRIAFTNLLYASDPAKPVSWRLKRVAPGLAVVSGPDGDSLYGSTDGWVARRRLRFEGDLMVLEPNGLALLGARELGWQGRVFFRAEAPVSVRLNLKEGSGVLLAKAPTKVTLDLGLEKLWVDNGEARRDDQTWRVKIGAGRTALDFQPAHEGDEARMLRRAIAAASEAASRRRVTAPPIMAPLPDLRKALDVELPAPAVEIAAPRTPRGKRLAVALRNGAVLCLTPKGETLWTRRLGTGAARLACADLDGDGVDEVVAAARGGDVVAFRADGAVAWRKACDGDNGPCRFVEAADLDGDGRPEVLVGKQSLYLFGADGKLRWKHLKIDVRGRRIPVQRVAIADCAGDARPEIVCVTQFPAQLWMWDADRKDLFTKGRYDHGRTDTCGQSVGVDAFDSDGDGKAEIFNAVSFGACRHLVHGRSGPKHWLKRNAGTAIAHVRGDGKRQDLVLATETGDLIRATHDMRNRWHLLLDAAPVLLATTADLARTPTRIATALANGDLVVVSGDGKPLARFTTRPARPTALRILDLDNDGRPEYLLAREDGRLYLLTGN